MKRRGVRWLVAYLILLAASHLWRMRSVADLPLAEDERVLTVAALGRHVRAGEMVRILFRRVCPASSQAPAVVLIHGSPGSKSDLAGFVPTLARERCVLLPDLPGFGSSTRAVPDYSFRAHAAYVRTLLDTLALTRVHVLGFSMGGGAALSLIDLDEPRVTSLTLVSAIGVQELELFGNHQINHALHGAQLAGLWTLFEATPHFGFLDGAMFDVSYARNFFDSDQRPLRGILRQVVVPTLIVHGRQDALVPYEAALEHHRLIPQSELHTFQAGHFGVFRDGPGLAAVVAAFLRRVDAGAMPARAEADRRRVTDAGQPFDPARVPPFTGLRLFVALLAGTALFLPVSAGVWYASRVVRRRRRSHQLQAS